MRSTETAWTSSSSRTISPYVVSLVALPALLAPFSDAASQVIPPVPRVSRESVSVSSEGLTLDRSVAAIRRDIDLRSADLSEFVPDLTFPLRPSRRTHHTARVVLRNTALPYAGGPTDFPPLD
jgi:hypothetical protein